MSLDAGSVKGSFELETDEYTGSLLNLIGVTRQATDEMTKSFEEVGASTEEAGESEDKLGEKTVSLQDQLAALAESAGMAVGFKALSAAVMEGVAAFGEAEKVSDRLKLALDMRGLSESFPLLDEMASKMQAITGVSDETFKQIAAEMIAQGKSIADVQKMISASSAYASATGQDLMSTYQQLNGTYTGTAGRLTRMIPALGNLTEEQLKNGAAIDYINKQYGAFTGSVGETEIAMNSTKELIGDLSEALGESLKPMVMLATTALSGLVKIILQAPKPLKDIFGVITTVGLAAFTALAIRTAIVTAAKWGLFGANMAVNAAMAVGNPLLWVGIAAATAAVIATGALIASKVKEAKAIKEANDAQDEQAGATRDATRAMKAHQNAIDEYMKTLDGLSDKELETTQITLNAYAMRSTGAMRTYYEERLRLVNLEIAERNAAKLAEERKQKSEDAAQAYASEMKVVIQTIEAAKTEEQKLLEQIKQVQEVKTKNEADEAKRKQALSILEQKLADVRAKIAADQQEAAEKQKQLDEEIAKKSMTKEQAQKVYWESVKNSAAETFNFIAKASEATFDGMTNTMMSSMKEFSSMTATLQGQEMTNQKAMLENNYKERKRLLDEQLAQELISQEEYDAALGALDDEKKQRSNELAKTQFENKKAANIAGVWMDAASSILGWWKVAPDLGPVAGPIFGGVMSAVSLGYAATYAGKIAQEEFVPAYEKGGTTGEGFARVNEKGGEIVWLPDGTLVVPNDISNRIAANGNKQVNISVSFAGATIDRGVNLDSLAEAVANKIAKKARGL